MKKNILIVLFVLTGFAVFCTTLQKAAVNCGVCGKSCEVTIIGSTNTMGYPDLDMRQPEMARSTIRYQVQKCPNCGFCNTDITKGIQGAWDFMQKSVYKEALGRTTVPELANMYNCASMLYQNNRQYSEAALMMLNCAWVMDDANMILKVDLNKGTYDASKPDDQRLLKQAAGIRAKVIALLLAAQKKGQKLSPDPVTESLILLDLYRRSGNFEKAAEVCANQLKMSKDEPLVKVLKFQKNLIEKKDTARHDIGEAIGEKDRKATIYM